MFTVTKHGAAATLAAAQHAQTRCVTLAATKAFDWSTLQTAHPSQPLTKVMDLTVPFPPITRTGRRKDSTANVTISPVKLKSSLTAESRTTLDPNDPSPYLLPRFTVNGQSFQSYVARDTHRSLILTPLERTQTLGAFNIKVTVKGGGATGQSGAIAMGIARCLDTLGGSGPTNNEGGGGEMLLDVKEGHGMFKALLKATESDPNGLLRGVETGSGFLQRDPRVVERKKAGLKKARKAFQWVKR